MSRAKYIQAKLNAKKRQVMLMRGGITVATLCVALFFVFMPDATSGTGGLAERETPPEPIEEPKTELQTSEIETPPLTMDDSISPSEQNETPNDSLPLVAEANIEEPPGTDKPAVASPDPTPDVEGGSRSPERENTNNTQPQSSTANVSFASPESVLGTPSTQAQKHPEEPVPTYMKMPDYKSATLKYKLGLIGSDAYSPSDKERLHQHIIGLFASPNAQVDAIYLEAGGQKFTKSYPIKLYLLRLEQNPSIRVRSIEKVQEGGRLSSLIITE